MSIDSVIRKKPETSHSLLATMAIVFACLLWGTTGTAASFVKSVSPLAIGAFAMGVSGLLMGLHSLPSLLKERSILHKCWGAILLGGLSVAIYPLAFYSSMSLAGVAVGTVISIACAPFFSVLLEIFIDQTKVSQQWKISFIVCSIGIIALTLSRQPLQQENSGDEYILGIVLGILAAFTYASYSWTAKSMIKQGVSSSSAMSVMFLFASLLLLPSLLISNEPLFSNTINITALLYLALIPMFIGYLAFAYGLQSISASQATLITLLEPAVAAMLAVMVIGEQLSWAGWVGIVLIMFGLLLQFRQIETKKPS